MSIIQGNAHAHYSRPVWIGYSCALESVANWAGILALELSHFSQSGMMGHIEALIEKQLFPLTASEFGSIQQLAPILAKQFLLVCPFALCYPHLVESRKPRYFMPRRFN